MQKIWRIQPHDQGRIDQLVHALGTPYLVAQLLAARGMHDATAARQFLECKLSALRDPQMLPGASDAARIIYEAITRRERIIVYGDYDVDGMTATAIMLLCLRYLGADVGYYVPNRLEEGYGLSIDAIRRLHEQGAKLIVTVDCGIGSVEEARLAAELGLTLVITDHHTLGPQLPAAAACVHPQLPGGQYPFAGLSGSGVALKLAWALCQQSSGSDKVAPRLRDFLLQAVGLAALGTIADVVPLVDENRVLVHHGLKSLKRFSLPGPQALMQAASLDQKAELDSEDVAFQLAPRLNAAGRMGQAQLGVDLLVTDNPARAKELADYLTQLNESRQSLERGIYLAASKQVKEQFPPEHNAALVVSGRGWHAGVIGIVAGRLAERFHRPVVVLSLDDLGVKAAVGSARSIRGFDLHSAIAACSEHLLSFGGHTAAAGLRIDEAHIEVFRDQLCEYASTEMHAVSPQPELWIDAEAPLANLTPEALRMIERLAPFGQGNHRPVFCATGARLAEAPRRIGGGGHHLSIKLVQHQTTIRGVAFGMGDRADELAGFEQQALEVAFHPVFNNFRGRSTVELQLLDWRPLTAERSAAPGNSVTEAVTP